MIVYRLLRLVKKYLESGGQFLATTQTIIENILYETTRKKVNKIKDSENYKQAAGYWGAKEKYSRRVYYFSNIFDYLTESTKYQEASL